MRLLRLDLAVGLDGDVLVCGEGVDFVFGELGAMGEGVSIWSCFEKGMFDGEGIR